MARLKTKPPVWLTMQESTDTAANNMSYSLCRLSYIPGNMFRFFMTEPPGKSRSYKLYAVPQFPMQSAKKTMLMSKYTGAKADAVLFFRNILKPAGRLHIIKQTNIDSIKAMLPVKSVGAITEFTCGQFEGSLFDFTVLTKSVSKKNPSIKTYAVSIIPAEREVSLRPIKVTTIKGSRRAYLATMSEFAKSAVSPVENLQKEG